jgi:hypothetical protein
MKCTKEALAAAYRDGENVEAIARRAGISVKTLHNLMSAQGAKSPLFRPTWTDDEVRLVGQLREEGLSASMIAARVGRTRNAVIGIINRRFGPKGETKSCAGGVSLKPKRRGGNPRSLSAPKVRKKHGPRPKSPFYLIGKGPALERCTAPIRCRMDAIPMAPVSLRARLTDLKKRQCHWPTHEESGLHLFCGALATEGEPYCSCHARAKTARGLNGLRAEALQEAQSCA